jgi:hypothetical protein
MANIPPKMIIKLIALFGGLIIFIIIIIWTFILVLQKFGIIESDDPDIGGSKWQVSVVQTLSATEVENRRWLQT